MKEKLNRLPKAVGIAVLAVCVLLGVYCGNRNALRAAVAEAELNLPAVEQILAERAGKASNLITLGERYLPQSNAVQQLQKARDEVLEADGVQTMYEANLRLSSLSEAVYIALQAEVDGTDARLLLSAMDELRSSQLQLERAAQAYNDAIAEARQVYNRLPARLLLQKPEGFQ